MVLCLIGLGLKGRGPTFPNKREGVGVFGGEGVGFFSHFLILINLCSWLCVCEGKSRSI